MADPRTCFAYALMVGGLALAPVAGATAGAAAATTGAQDGPLRIDGWSVDYDDDRCYMVRSTGDGRQGIEFQLLEDDTARMLFMRGGWPPRTGSASATLTIAGERTTRTARLSISDGELLVSFEIPDSLIDGLEANTVIGLDVPELGISAGFDVGTIAAARTNMYDCAMVMLW